jgi:ribosomal protein S18 acetylase RimI-like enzyme
MTRARELLLDQGCPKINLQVRSGNDAAIGFYESIGYADDSVTSLGLRLILDN